MPLLRLDVDPVLLAGLPDPIPNRFHILFVVLGGIVLLVDVASGSPDMLLGFDGVLLVGRIGERHIAVVMLARFGVYLVALFNRCPRNDLHMNRFRVVPVLLRPVELAGGIWWATNSSSSSAKAKPKVASVIVPSEARRAHPA